LEFLQKESGKSVGNVNQLESEKLSLEHKVGVLEKSLEQQSQVMYLPLVATCDQSQSIVYTHVIMFIHALPLFMFM
jgi:uncharacterized protein YueI